MWPAECLSRKAIATKQSIWVAPGWSSSERASKTIAMIQGGTPRPKKSVESRHAAARERARCRRNHLSRDRQRALDVIITWDQTAVMRSRAAGAVQNAGRRLDDDAAADEAFHRIPPGNIQAIFMRMQRVPTAPGEVVIKQGDEGDYFYVLVNGKCVVHARTPLQQGGDQAFRARRREQLRRGGTDRRGETQRNRHMLTTACSCGSTRMIFASS